VYFVFDPTNLVPGDNNSDRDIFEKNLVTGAVRKITVQAEDIDISSDGVKLAYQSWRSGTGADDGLFLADLKSGVETHVSKETDGTPLDLRSLGGSFSPDGKGLVFYPFATNMVSGSGGTVQISLRNLESGEIKKYLRE
jgi:Tol biopolymer transport system component